MTLFALIFSVLISSVSLAWGFAQSGLTSIAIWLLMLGAFWLFAIWQRWEWASSVGLIIYVIAAALGLWLHLSPGWMFSGGLFALFAWDMQDFKRRLQFIVYDDNTKQMERRHIARVSLLALAGLTLASITMFVRAQFSMEWAALLAGITLLGLAQMAGWFKKF